MSQLLPTTLKILKRLCPPNSTLIFAFSGGSDSVCLLDILKNSHYKIILAHVNHKLRGPESEANEHFVKTLAKKYQLPLEIKKIDVKAWQKTHGLNLEAAGRKIRYDFFHQLKKKHKADYILTAHHLNDNIETILLNLSRGCGLDGLKGIMLINNDLIRPLINTPKSAILNYLKKHRLVYHDDLSNRDISLKRNNLRLNILPLWKRINPKLENDWQKAIKNWQKIYHVKQEISQTWLEKNLTPSGLKKSAFKKIPPDFQSEIIIGWYKKIYGSTVDLNTKKIQELQILINQNKTGLKKAFGQKYWLKNNYDLATLTKKSDFLDKSISSNKIYPIKISSLTKIKTGQINYEIKTKIIKPKTCPEYSRGVKKSDTGIKISLDKLPDKKLYLRFWQPGDHFRPLGLTGQKKLQDIFTDLKIPRQQRNTLPIFIDKNNHIIALSNIMISEDYKITPETKQALGIKVSRVNM